MLSKSACAVTPWVDKYENVGVTAMGKFMFPLVDYAAAMPLEVERRTLTPPDPQLKSAWYPGGFNPCTYQVKTRFQNLLSK